MDALVSSMNELESVDRVAVQDVLYSDYAVNGQDSDSEGQLIPYGREDNRYLFFTEDLSAYLEETPDMTPGEVYVSPSMVSMFGIKTGDEICFSIMRGQPPEVFSVRGFYEDPFMGSSIIGMKGFLIDETDYHRILEAVREAGIDALARDGAMLHIFQSADDPLSVSQLNSMINTSTRLPEYMEFLHSADAISGFMLILQNAFGGLMAAFAAVLLAAVLVVLGHSIASSVEDDYVNMGILKTIGFTVGKLRRIQMLQYLIPILSGLGLGIFLAVFLSRIAAQTTLTVTGIRIPSVLPLGACVLCYTLIIFLLAGFLVMKTGKINQISPMKAIRGEAFSTQRSDRPEGRRGLLFRTKPDPAFLSGCRGYRRIHEDWEY